MQTFVVFTGAAAREFRGAAADVEPVENGMRPGAVIGAYILGFGEVASLVYLPTELRDAFAFGLLFLVLLFRPSGLLGQRAADRV